MTANISTGSPGGDELAHAPAPLKAWLTRTWQSLLTAARGGTGARPGSAARPELDPHVAAALADRAKRAEARELAVRDPLLAREIHIGRPDLTRGYDDGGLVDLNTAPPEVIAQVCAIARTTAESIVAARPGGVGYRAVDDVFTAAEIPVTAQDRIRDRSLVLPA
jgi:DNA uptake protein ComE-like DNA-binding protein